MSVQLSNPASERLVVDGRLHPGWRAVAGSFVGLGAGPSIALVISFGVFSPMLRETFGWTNAGVSLGATVICLTLAFVSPLHGWLVDRLGARRMLLVSLPLFGLGLAAMSRLGPDIGMFYVACGLLVVAAIGAWPLSYMTVLTTWFDQRLGLALGVAQIGAGLGGALIPALLAVTFAQADWRTGYLILGAIQIFLLLPLAIGSAYERPDTVRGRGAGGVMLPGLSVAEVLRSRSFHLLAIAFLLLGVFSSGIIFHQVSIMLDHGLSQSAAIATQSALLLASMFGRFLAGWALDRVRVTRLMPAILLASALACVVYAAEMPIWVLVACAMMVGFAVGAEFDVMGYAIRRYHGMRAFGRVFGLIYGAFQIGSAIGAGLVGYLRDSTGSYDGALLLLGGLSLVSGAILALLGPYRFAAASADAEKITAVGDRSPN